MRALVTASAQPVNIDGNSRRAVRWVTVKVKGPVVLDDSSMTVQAAIDGVGLAFAFEEHVAVHVAKCRLIRVLEDWCPPFPGFFRTTRVAGTSVPL
jgi:DNA-binding transcriptional LysR family regulator